MSNIYGISPSSSIYKNGSMKVSIIKGPEEDAQIRESVTAFQSRNCFMTQHPKRAGLKSYTSSRHNKEINDELETTINMINAEKVKQSEYIKKIVGGNFNFDTDDPFPLKNSAARKLVKGKIKLN